MFTSDDRKAAAAINAALIPLAFGFEDRWVAIGWHRSHFVLLTNVANPLNARHGEVAEWLKAAVC
jgi:hypothetical protein